MVIVDWLYVQVHASLVLHLTKRNVPALAQARQEEDKWSKHLSREGATPNKRGLALGSLNLGRSLGRSVNLGAGHRLLPEGQVG